MLTPRLLRGLCTMSLVKAVPKGIRDKECKRFTLCKHPLVSYVPEKDPVQETVSALKSNQSLKTTIGDDAKLRILIWHAGMHEAFLMQVSTALNAIKKQGTFKALAEACVLYVDCKAVKQAKAALDLVNATTSKGEKNSKKASQKPKEGAAPADAIAPELRAECEKTLRRPNLPQRPPRTRKNLLQRRCSSSMQTCCLWTLSMRGTRLSRSRRRRTFTRIFKACPGKAQWDCHASHSMTVSCSTFSPCFPTTRLSKKLLPFKRAQEVPAGWRTSIRTACKAAQRLHRATALLVLQPKQHFWYDTGKCSIHQG
jgi:hypothetical protein